MSTFFWEEILNNQIKNETKQHKKQDLGPISYEEDAGTQTQWEELHVFQDCQYVN